MQNIISVTKKDFGTIAALAKEIWTTHYTPIIGSEQVTYMLEKFQSVEAIAEQTENGYLYFLINYNEQPVGYISIKPEADQLFLSKIYVHEKCRGLGLGKLAMSFVEQYAAQNSLSKLYLTVNKYNTGSINAYLKMGFSKTEALVMDIGNGYVMDDYKMEKPITSH